MSAVIVTLAVSRVIYREDVRPFASSVSRDFAQKLVDQLGRTDGRSYVISTIRTLKENEVPENGSFEVGDIVINVGDFGPRERLILAEGDTFVEEQFLAGLERVDHEGGLDAEGLAILYDTP